MGKRRKPFRLPKFNFLGIGVVYAMIYVPNILAIKLGYTGVSVANRAKSVSDDVFGWAIPVGAFILPFAWHLEQFLLSLLSGLKWRFYRGQGSTEAHMPPAQLIILPIVWFGMYLNYLAVKWVWITYF